MIDYWKRALRSRATLILAMIDALTNCFALDSATPALKHWELPCYQLSI